MITGHIYERNTFFSLSKIKQDTNFDHRSFLLRPPKSGTPTVGHNCQVEFNFFFFQSKPQDEFSIVDDTARYYRL